MKLNLGSGRLDVNDDAHVDFVRVDNQPAVEPDELVDLQSWPWPWDDESVDEIYCAHYVEHQTGRDWIRFMEEAWRILRVEGVMTVIHPNLQTGKAFADPTHLDFIPGDRWLYASRQWRQEHGLDRPPYPDCDFGIKEIVYGNFEDGLELRSQEAQQSAIVGRWNTAFDVMAVLTKKV